MFGNGITSGNRITFSTNNYTTLRPLAFVQHGYSSEVTRPITRHYKTLICEQQVQNKV